MNTSQRELKACFSKAAILTVLGAMSIGGLIGYDLHHGTLGVSLANVAIKNDQPIILAALDTMTIPVIQRRNLLLKRAAESGSNRTIDWLVANGADLHYEYDSPLILAAQYGHLSTANYLLDQGADINAGSDLALFAAAANGQEHMVDLLLERGANADSIKGRWCPRYLSLIPPASEEVIQRLGPNLCQNYQP